MQFIQVEKNRVIKYDKIVDAYFLPDCKIFKVIKSNHVDRPVGWMTSYRWPQTENFQQEELKVDKLVLIVEFSAETEEVVLYGQAAAIIWEKIVTDTYAVSGFNV